MSAKRARLRHRNGRDCDPKDRIRDGSDRPYAKERFRLVPDDGKLLEDGSGVRFLLLI